MKTIIVDGHEFELEHTEASAGNPERVVVWTLDEELVGDVVLDHNLEHAEADLGRGREAVGYFEFKEKTPSEIGEWIASCSEGPVEDYDDGQPTMYEEYQDLYGGDDFPEQWEDSYDGMDW
jgi:hypothetical protein